MSSLVGRQGLILLENEVPKKAQSCSVAFDFFFLNYKKNNPNKRLVVKCETETLRDQKCNKKRAVTRPPTVLAHMKKAITGKLDCKKKNFFLN